MIGWGRAEWGVTPNGYGISLGDDKNILKLMLMVAQLNIVKTTELYTLKEWVSWYMNYISKLFKKKYKTISF